MDAVGIVESVEKYRVIDGVKGGTDIKGDKDCGWVLVYRVEDAVKG